MNRNIDDSKYSGIRIMTGGDTGMCLVKHKYVNNPIGFFDIVNNRYVRHNVLQKHLYNNLASFGMPSELVRCFDEQCEEGVEVWIIVQEDIHVRIGKVKESDIIVKLDRDRVIPEGKIIKLTLDDFKDGMVVKHETFEKQYHVTMAGRSNVFEPIQKQSKIEDVLK